MKTACIVPSACMETELECLPNDGSRSQMLQKIAKQLKFYLPTSLKLDVEKHHDINIHSKLVIEEPVKVEAEQVCQENLRRRAAVLICLFEGYEGELRVILTKRSMKLSSHPGDVALPGGKMEEGDADYTATALREAKEEIGLDPSLVQVVANMEPFMSQHQLKVVPVVGLLGSVVDFKPALNIDEVDAVFDAPLEMFLKEENHRCEEKEWMGRKFILHLFDFESEQGFFLIFGLTASILIRAASVIYKRPPCFNQHLPDFQQLQTSLNNAA